MFQPLKSFLSGAMQRRDIHDGVRAAVIIDAAREAIDALFPAEVAFRIMPKAFKNETLVLGVHSSIVAQEIKLQSRALLRLIEERLQKPLVKRLRVALLPPRQSEEDMLR